MLTETSLDAALNESRPNPLDVDDVVLVTINQMVDAVSAPPSPRRKSRSSRWMRPAFVIPAIGLLAVAITAGAVAYSFSRADVAVIPINYTTAAGQHISCGYGLGAVAPAVNGTPATAFRSTSVLRTYVQSHDWTGVGQRVYEYALSHPYHPSAAETGTLTRTQIDSFSFSSALVAVLDKEIPSSVEPWGFFAGGETDCRGILR